VSTVIGNYRPERVDDLLRYSFAPEFALAQIIRWRSCIGITNPDIRFFVAADELKRLTFFYITAEFGKYLGDQVLEIHPIFRFAVKDWHDNGRGSGQNGTSLARRN